MRTSGASSLFQWLSVAATLAAVLLLAFEMVAYSRARAKMPPGLQVAGVPVGGLSREQALAQVINFYSSPLELLYGQSVILLKPAEVGFQLDTEAMLAAADQYRTDDPFWTGFWDYIWRTPGRVEVIPLRFTYSEPEVRRFLTDVAARYDQPASAARPIPGTLGFEAGAPGQSLDVDTSTQVVGAVLQQPANRRAALALTQGRTARPTFESLSALVKQHVADQGFAGLVDVVVVDLRSGAELHLILRGGNTIPGEPDVAFAAMDLMKIPLMVETYRQWDRPPTPEVARLLTETIALSGNDRANALLAGLGNGDGQAGAQNVSAALHALGLVNSFMAGPYGQSTAPAPITTPANQREDVNTAPDVLMQTTPTDLAFLLTAIYQCAARGNGTFALLFAARITRAECQQMLEALSQNRVGVLIEAGVPEGVRVAHKQGWIGDTNGDAAIVFTPGGDYVLSVFLWQPDSLPWETSSPLTADLRRAVYNYFNAPPR
ncbi:MAG: serine hydrolase [Chloroflexi bacterium]|nr:serine hydrolase [Chloroflexota bacterium]